MPPPTSAAAEAAGAKLLRFALDSPKPASGIGLLRLGLALRRGLLLGIVLRKSLFDGDALVLGLALGLDLLDALVVRKVLEVLGVVVRLVRLRLGRRVELLCRAEGRCVRGGGMRASEVGDATFVVQEELYRGM